MKSFNRYKEDTMKGFNRYAAFSLRAILAAAVVMFGIIRPNDYGSRAEPTAFAAEQLAPGALQWRQTSGPEGADVISLLSVGPNLFAGTTISGVFRSTNQGESWTPINEGLLSQSVQSLAAVGTSIFAAIRCRGGFSPPGLVIKALGRENPPLRCGRSQFSKAINQRLNSSAGNAAGRSEPLWCFRQKTKTLFPEYLAAGATDDQIESDDRSSV